MLTPQRINMEDYVLSGGGFNGESYYHRTDPSVMLKLYFPGKVQQPLDELMLARKVHALGIATPEPGDFVLTDDGRYGIRFSRIRGKKSFARAVGDNPGEVGRLAREFAVMCKELHSIEVDPSMFENVKDRYFSLLETNPFFTAQEKDSMARFIAETPDAFNALHGDLQFSNAIFSDTGRYFIDLGDFCYGNPLFDIGMVYVTCLVSDEDFIRETYHMEKTVSRQFWAAFAKAYFGEDMPLDEVDALVRPYAGLKALIIERDMNSPMSALHEALKPASYCHE